MKEHREMIKTPSDPRLYIIMREDLQDMNPGKGMAQAAHAQADMLAYAVEQSVSDPNLLKAFTHWMGSDREFGTTLVLNAPQNEFENITRIAPHSGYTVDPTYPWRNWYGTLYLTREITCMWAFVWDPADIKLMRTWPLHK